MELIFAAALCSVLVSIVLKVARQHGYQPLHLISWNYLAASVLCFFWFKPNLTEISINQTPWWLIGMLGLALPSVFLCLVHALQHAGVLKTEIAQRLSVVLSLLAAYFIFHESFNALKLFGIALGIVAVACIVYSHKQGSSTGQQGILYLLLVWGGYALIDVLLKYSTGLGMQFAPTLNLIFICAFIFSLSFIVIRERRMSELKNIVAGLGLGVLNFANIAFYVKAHMLLKDSPAVVFAGMNILVVILGVIAGVYLFKEKLKPSAILGLILGVGSVGCLAFTML